MKTSRHIRFVLILLVILSFSKGLYGQSRDTCKIYFAQNSSYLVSSFNDNKESIAKLKTILATPRTVDTIYINVFSSPEGQLRTNEWLTDRRANRLLTFVQRHSKGKISRDRIVIHKVSENWDGLKSAIVNNYHGKHRDTIIGILYNPDLTDHQKKLAIKRLENGALWTYFINEYMRDLRYADEIVLVRVLDLPRLQEYTSKVESELPSSGLIPQTFQIPAPVISTQDQFCMGIRTNLMYDLLMVPNLGMEFHLGKRFSLGANYCHAWWDNDVAHNYWRIYGGDVYFRKYFGGKKNWPSLSGHHLGLYGQAYSYDFELGAQGQMSDLTYGGGLEYGYTVPLCKSLALDFSLGCGYLTGEYKVYEPQDDCYVWKETRQRHYLGPTKAEISFIWVIANNKKGGRR